jgi:hypothetical protein
LLLEWAKGFPDRPELQLPSQADLAIIYSEKVAPSAMAMRGFRDRPKASGTDEEACS